PQRCLPPPASPPFLTEPPPGSTLFPYTTLFRSMFFERLGLEGVQLEINSIGDKQCRPKYVELLRAELQKVKDQLGPDSQRRIERSEEHTSELQSCFDLVCRLLLEKKK